MARKYRGSEVPRPFNPATIKRMIDGPMTKICGALDPSFLASDEVLADHLRDFTVKRDGELVFPDAFDLAVAEHRMMYGVASRE